MQRLHYQPPLPAFITSLHYPDNEADGNENPAESNRGSVPVHILLRSTHRGLRSSHVSTGQAMSFHVEAAENTVAVLGLVASGRCPWHRAVNVSRAVSTRQCRLRRAADRVGRRQYTAFARQCTTEAECIIRPASHQEAPQHFVSIAVRNPTRIGHPSRLARL